MTIAKRLVKTMGFKWIPQPSSTDTGVDAIIEVVDPHTRAATNRTLSVQVKATSASLLNASNQIKYACSQADLQYWYVGTTPALLVVASVPDDAAWFASIRDYFAAPPGSGRTVHMDAVVDRLGPGARAQIEEVAYSGRTWNWWEVHEPNEVSLSYLYEFHRGLKAALHDRISEQEAGPCPIYVDTDIAVEGLFPLEGVVRRSLHELEDDRVFSRTLWRFGFLGRPSLLGGHQEELRDFLKRRQSAATAEYSSLDSRPETLQLLVKLKAAVQESDIRAFAATLASTDRGTAMLTAALLHGNEGLGAALSLLRPQMDEFSSVDALDQPRTEYFLKAIRRADPLRRSVDVNSIRDAVALSHLAERVDLDRRHGIRQAGYFLTGTRILGELVRHDREFASAFIRTEPMDGSAIDHPSSVWRSMSYFRCRALFDALRPEEAFSNLPTAPASKFSLDHLSALCSQLESVISTVTSRSNTPLSLIALERMGIRGPTLVAVCVYIQSIAFAKRMWLHDTAAAIGRLAAVVGNTDVAEFARLRFSELDDAFGDLERSEVARFHERAEALIARVDSQ